MKRAVFINSLICCCLLLALSGCGNKSPLVPAESEQPKKTKSENS